MCERDREPDRQIETRRENERRKQREEGVGLGWGADDRVVSGPWPRAIDANTWQTVRGADRCMHAAMAQWSCDINSSARTSTTTAYVGANGTQLQLQLASCN